VQADAVRNTAAAGQRSGRPTGGCSREPREATTWHASEHRSTCRLDALFRFPFSLEGTIMPDEEAHK
jgi:hypothetical protein